MKPTTRENNMKPTTSKRKYTWNQLPEKIYLKNQLETNYQRKYTWNQLPARENIHETNYQKPTRENIHETNYQQEKIYMKPTTSKRKYTLNY